MTGTPMTITGTTAADVTQIDLVRHGHSHSNSLQKIHGPRLCQGLTDIGRGQAALLADRIRTEHTDTAVTAVYSTPPARAHQTAQPIADALGLEVEFLDHWRYPEYGSAEGRGWAEVYAGHPAGHPALAPDHPIADGAETHAQVRAVTLQAITELLRRHRGKRMVLAGSTENVLAVYDVLLGLPADARIRWKPAVGHTSITTFCLRHPSWSPLPWRAELVRANDIAHLPAAQQAARFRTPSVLGA
ncbi:histidine phosphatase family protein [Nocardia sp. alder85J]|uniref:histidine phosphatase family protein n=1 Tax=Nocardia sp. alder85J TaxID=2862949 RepID=UPI001CD254D0|nr:histidine phosphatase family protein [Nocardia sp. alder85J]MCX4097735.1 histidine phosphatase family protein [Nocardia sp. alder85J]